MDWLRFELWVLRRLDQATRWVCDRRNRLEEVLAHREAIPVGTRIQLTCLECGFGGVGDWQHRVTWVVARFNSDPGDYYLTTTEGPDDEFKHDGIHFAYAREDAMRVVNAA